MILDERSEFADATALSTSGTGRQLVGDALDNTKVSSAIGDGEGAYLVIQVETAFTSGGSATVSFELASDAGAAIQTDGSATVHFATAAIPVSSLTAGTNVARIKLPLGNYERYVGILANVGTAALTAGKINAFITPEIASWRATADSI